MKQGKLIRLNDVGEKTIGTFQLFDEAGNVLFTCNTLEKSWHQNQRGISCIPAGIYQCKFSLMVSHNVNHYQLLDVPGRAAIFIHSANFQEQLRGCISFGEWDGYILLSSKIKISEFENILNGEDFSIEISNEGLTQVIT